MNDKYAAIILALMVICTVIICIGLDFVSKY